MEVERAGQLVTDEARAEVGAGTERLVARTGEHDGTDAGISLRRRERFTQLGHHLRRHRVVAFRPVDGHRRDTTGDVVEDRLELGHGPRS